MSDRLQTYRVGSFVVTVAAFGRSRHVQTRQIFQVSHPDQEIIRVISEQPGAKMGASLDADALMFRCVSVCSLHEQVRCFRFPVDSRPHEEHSTLPFKRSGNERSEQ